MKGWKTITLAVLIALAGFFEQLRGVIPEDVVGMILIVIGFLVALLRLITDTAVFKQE